MKLKPRMAVSSCLLGHKVRYDATGRYDLNLVKVLERYFSLVAICPEVAIGLGVPRATIHRVRAGDQERLVQADDPSKDLTDEMQEYFVQSLPELESVCGYVFKARSPSCGPANVPVRDEKGNLIGGGKGLFAHVLTASLPRLPVSDETSLGQPQARDRFIKQALVFHSWQGI